ncbi:hypothetical protein [Kitasatospora phosalacinea]|uniref:Uncharacterized protein n=1 Tax=Kitasatospora phosalacinea TaxID=2065 RepID=A0A9W6UNB7_9ACTN|nr:hypothetical protein [Kitasatospora phosalacinea]GLW54689.1 hypothetical protein Kpho01_27000 [Kitasatospora phosalacinea]
MKYAYTLRVTLDSGATWKDHAADPYGVRETDATAAQLASDLLNEAFEVRLKMDGSEPLGELQCCVWDGPRAQGAPAAVAASGTDLQWKALERTLSEVANDIARFEEEKRKADQAAASAQTAILNARRRLENLALAGLRSSMPQVMIAHGARRSREWVRRIEDDGTGSMADDLRAAVLEQRGTWNARRAVEALAAAGHDTDDKGARAVLRKLAADRTIIKTHPTSAIYEPNPDQP